MTANEILYAICISDCILTDTSWRHYRGDLVMRAKEIGRTLDQVMDDIKAVWDYRHGPVSPDSIDLDGMRDNLIRCGLKE